MYNEFTNKKLGEVRAFALVTADTLETGKEALQTVLDPEVYASLTDVCMTHQKQIDGMVEAHGDMNILVTKSDKTAEKLKSMRELYIGDQWHNPTEILEWSSFFHGAASAHWALIRGIGEGRNDEGLISLAEEAMNTHHEFLDTISSELDQVGQDKAMA